MACVAGGFRTARSATGSFQNLVSVVVPTMMPRYTRVPGIGRAVLRLAVGITEGARLDWRHAQEAETCLMKRDMFGNLTCKMHEALLRLEHDDDIRCFQTG